MERVYFDYAATTPTDPEVVKACLAVFKGSRYQFDSEEGSHPKETNAMMC